MKIVYSVLNDEQLILQLKKAERNALDEIYNRYSKFLFQYAYKRLDNIEDVPDLVQDIFLKLWINKETIEMECSIQAYLTFCLKNLIIDKFRRNKLKNEYLESSKTNEQYSTITEDQIDYRDFQRKIQLNISKLPTKMQEVFILRKIKELSINEIAIRLNLSQQTVKNQIVSAVLRLKVSLNC